MEGWKEISLNKIGWFKGAGVNKLINSDEQPVYLVNYMDVYKHWRVYYNTNYQKVTAKDREIEEANLLEGDVLFTPSSEKPIDIGHAGVVMETMPNCVYSYHLIRLRLFDTTQFDLKFLSYLLNSDDVQKHFVSRASGSGIRYTLSLSDFKSARIKFPGKSEQTAIAAILSKVDEAIAAVQGSISAAERLKKSLMQNLLTGRMKPDGTLRTEEEFYLDEKFGRVPKGWEVKKVKECFKFKNGKGNTTSNLKENPDEEYCIPVFGGNGITGYYHSALLIEPTIVIGRVGEYCGNVFQTPEKSWVTDNAMLVSEVLMKEYDIDFFTLKLNSLKFKQFSDSTGQPKITQGSIGSVLFAYPSNVNEQNDIMSLISYISNKVQQKQNKIAVFERLKKSLMQNLLTGRVRVK